MNSIAVVTICLGLVGEAQADQGDCDATLVGQNNPATDANAVSAFVNEPHASDPFTLCLSGVFDFGLDLANFCGATASPPRVGPPCFVEINPPDLTELNIVGLDDDAGNMATILNGLQTVRIPPEATVPVVTIGNIRFVSPTFTAFSIFQGQPGGLVEVWGVRVEDAQALFVPAFGIALREGVAVTSAFANIEGSVVIRDSFFQSGEGGEGDQVNTGAGVFGRYIPSNAADVLAKVLVVNNTFVNWVGADVAVAADGVDVLFNTFDGTANNDVLLSGIDSWAAPVDRNRVETHGNDNYINSVCQDGSTIRNLGNETAINAHLAEGAEFGPCGRE